MPDINTSRECQVIVKNRKFVFRAFSSRNRAKLANRLSTMAFICDPKLDHCTVVRSRIIRQVGYHRPRKRKKIFVDL